MRVVAKTPENWGDWFLGTPLMIICIIAGAFILRWLCHRLISRVVRSMQQPSDRSNSNRAVRVLREATGLDAERRQQRAATTGSILRSLATVVIATIAILTILAELNVPLAPLMASAGVGGVALGFGAQSLVKDFLSGIFMIVEDQYGVGDVIDTGEAIGTVEEVSLRITRLRDANGVIWYIRNGEIIRIGNRSQGFSTALVDIAVGYDQPVERVLDILRGVADSVGADPKWQTKLIEPPEVAGVESVSGSAMTVRILAKCVANEQYGISRELRERAKVALDAAGIAGPTYPPFNTTGQQPG